MAHGWMAGLAPLGLVVPISTVQFVVSALFNAFINHEPTRLGARLALSCMCAGSTLLVAFGQKDMQASSLPALLALALQEEYIIYIAVVFGGGRWDILSQLVPHQTRQLQLPAPLNAHELNWLARCLAAQQAVVPVTSESWPSAVVPLAFCVTAIGHNAYIKQPRPAIVVRSVPIAFSLYAGGWRPTDSIITTFEEEHFCRAQSHTWVEPWLSSRLGHACRDISAPNLPEQRDSKSGCACLYAHGASADLRLLTYDCSRHAGWFVAGPIGAQATLYSTCASTLLCQTIFRGSSHYMVTFYSLFFYMVRAVMFMDWKGIGSIESVARGVVSLSGLCLAKALQMPSSNIDALETLLAKYACMQTVFAALALNIIWILLLGSVGHRPPAVSLCCHAVKPS